MCRQATIGLLFILLQIQAYSQYATSLKPISVYYGSTYRFDNTYRHVLAIDHWHYSSTCLSSRYFGFGISTEFTGKTNFNLGLRYYTAPGYRNRILIRYPLVYYGIAGTMYSIDDHQGLNIAPEIGLHPIFRFTRHVGFSVFIYYGYDISLLNQNNYTLNRHRLTIKIGPDYYRNKNRIKNCDTTATN